MDISFRPITNHCSPSFFSGIIFLHIFPYALSRIIVLWLPHSVLSLIHCSMPTSFRLISESFFYDYLLPPYLRSLLYAYLLLSHLCTIATSFHCFSDSVSIGYFFPSYYESSFHGYFHVSYTWIIIKWLLWDTPFNHYWDFFI